MESGIRKKLATIVGQRHLTFAPEDIVCYAYDSTGLEYPPAAVAFPGTTAEVAAIMRLASEARFPVVPRGAGTGMSGGSLAVAGGLVLAMSRFNRILEIDPENRVATVEPGVITGEFQNAVKKQGLYYPPDPASLNFCSMGGNVAECAGGPSAVKYGVTRDYVLGLEAVLPNGTVLETGVRTAKGVVGYDLTRLLVGSEGTLGVVTRIMVRLLSLPAAKETFLVLAPTLFRATTLVTTILQKGFLPCTLEYMDRTAIRTVAPMLAEPLPAGTGALLLVEVDGDKEDVAGQGRRLMEFLDSRPDLLAVRRAATAGEVDALWAARRAISPSLFQLKPHKISEDVVVPRNRIADLVDFVETLAAELDLVILTFGHAGDGNIHVNIMLDRENSDELSHARTAKKRLFVRVLELGGTLSGEHGVGVTKADYVDMELDPVSLAVMRRIKQVFDPHNILNPGKIFPSLID
ncbi:MAG: FAD-binding protein [Desulfobacterales bacterium]|nr:FAD-binding protein [Desulfobacterales bacterium]